MEDALERLTALEPLSRENERLQELVSDSEARFAAIFREAALGIILIDPRGTLAMANPAAARILGVSQNELRGNAICGLWANDELKWLRELLDGERDHFRFERSYERPDGTEVWCSHAVSLIRAATGEPEYALALIEDVTERRQAEEGARRLASEKAARAEAEAARERLAFLAEASVVLSSILDPAAALDKLARLAVPFLGDLCMVDVQDPDGHVKRVSEAARDSSLEARLRARPRVTTRRPGDPVLDVLRSGGTRVVTIEDAAPVSLDDLRHGERPAWLLVVPLTARARNIGAVVIGRSSRDGFSDADVTLAEEFARRAALAIDNARLYQSATEASRLKDEFLAVVSHELRTPLTPILGWAHMLRERKPDAKTLAAGLETIERNARAQARLIEDLLDVSRIISGKLRLDVKPVALAETIQDAVDSVRQAARAKGIERVTWTDANAPRVMGDPTRLLQVVWNLLSNAIKFTPAGGKVEARLTGSRGRAVVQITDTGEGIGAEFLPHLFERFRQAEAATTRKHGGLGLGLSIVRHLVELHGGTVSAASPGRGKGATFTVSLPALEENVDTLAPDQPSPHALAAPVAADRPRLKGMRVLLVDDQPDALDLLAAMLERFGATVTRAASTAEALEKIRQRAPDVLVSDIGMPGEDGYALIRKVRELPAKRGGEIPAVALTAFTRTEDRIRALDAGFQSHVAKPVEAAELAAVVAAVAPRRPARGGRKSRASS